MKSEEDLRRARAILLAAINTGCPCETVKDQEECEMGRMLLASAEQALAFALGENPQWELQLDVMSVLTKVNRANYGLRRGEAHGKET